ncbi:hypothetical protein tb265_39350 [Gemmatimonadetes bacterium T265]|nr:hypothetical protein tb265_39350 [Gemmatimonadetes bacterium T265]
MPATLDEVLRGMRAEAQTYGRNGDRLPPSALVGYADAVAACPDVQLLAWVPEGRAVARAGRDVRWFQRRRAEWLAVGLARETPSGWEYRAVVVPQRGDVGAEETPSLADRLLGAT